MLYLDLLNYNINVRDRFLRPAHNKNVKTIVTFVSLISAH